MGARGPGWLGSAAAAVAVLACTAGALKALDLLPELAPSAGHERRLAGVEALDRSWQRRLALPAYFPRSLGWPPSTVRTIGRPVHTVVLGFAAADAGEERLLLAQSTEGELPAAALPPGVVLGEQRLQLQGAPVELSRVLGADGFLWHQVRWSGAQGARALRSRESEEQVLRMANSVRSPPP